MYIRPTNFKRANAALRSIFESLLGHGELAYAENCEATLKYLLREFVQELGRYGMSSLLGKPFVQNV
jgi:hypothetical protein